VLSADLFERHTAPDGHWIMYLSFAMSIRPVMKFRQMGLAGPLYAL